MANRREFWRKFAERYGITYRDSEKICRDIFEFLGNLLYEEGEDVVITGFGSFKHKTAKPKRVTHPVTGEVMVMPERVFVKFIPSKALEKSKVDE